MPVELVEKKLQNALPVHLVAKDGLEAAGLAPAAIAWARANGFSGEAGRTLIVPGENGALAGALFGIGDGEGALAVGALARSLAGRRLAFRLRAGRAGTRGNRTGARRLCLHPLRQETRQGAALRAAVRRRCGACSPHRRWRFPDARSGQHADQRHGAGRAGEGGANPGRSAQGRNLGDQGRRSAQAEFPDDPRRRPCIDRRAASDRHDMGAEGRAEGDAGRQGRLLRHRRPRHQAVVRHAVDEEGHGRRRQRAWASPR